MVKLILQDGTAISGLSKNGNNFVSDVKIDEKIFKGLTTLTIKEDGQDDIVMHNAYLVQQAKYKDGYYLAFAEKTRDDILRERIADLEDALIEVYEMGV